MRHGSTAKLRSAIARVCHRREWQGRRYPGDLRRRIVVHVVAERSKGVSIRSTAASLGLSYPTLLGWLQAEPNGFRSVAVKTSEPDPASPVLRLVTAQGHRVEGLTREDVAFLLRSLP